MLRRLRWQVFPVEGLANTLLANSLLDYLKALTGRVRVSRQHRLDAIAGDLG
jgi:hypothetical protein